MYKPEFCGLVGQPSSMQTVDAFDKFLDIGFHNFIFIFIFFAIPSVQKPPCIVIMKLLNQILHKVLSTMPPTSCPQATEPSTTQRAKSDIESIANYSFTKRFLPLRHCILNVSAFRTLVYVAVYTVSVCSYYYRVSSPPRLCTG